MRDDTGSWREELTRFPKTGRFLAGRLRHAMTPREKQVLESLVSEVREVARDTRLVARGDYCDHSILLIDGFVMRIIKDDNTRSIVGLHVPGDFVDLHAFALKRLDHDLVTLGRAKIGVVPHEALREVLEREPHLARLLWFGTLLDAAIHREWLSKMGRLRAVGRVAHALIETWYRLRLVALGSPDGCHTPLTQIHLSEMCGISEIHTNRSIRDLRAGGVVEFRRGRMTILDLARLEGLARFDPAYLYGEGRLAVRAQEGAGARRASR